MRLSRSQRRTGTRRPQRGAVDPAWRVALDDEAFVVDARVGVRSVVQPGMDHAHQLVGGDKAPSRNPTLRGPDD